MNKITPTLLSLAVLTLASSPSFAQMQIPNPLIQPQGRAKPATQATDGKDVPAPFPANYAPRGMSDLPYPQANGSNGNAKTPFAEVRDKLATFYVSAIVGNQAILRRGVVTQPVNVGAQQNPMAMAPQQYNAAQQINKPAAAVQTETMFVTDGEPIDFVGDAITLIPKVTANRVCIYYTEDGASQKNSRRQVAFLGQVETSTASAPPAIVLEKSDPAYKQFISVDLKSRNGGGASAQPSTNPSMVSTPPTN
ncbi:hypothetical protein ACFOFO_19790 [Undibacterium arcticum]|uniref:Uncharacterized protein n=2 Tax=Undibacterium arcticum TaxID=1762892 RepID=A0ABV7F912_9BURK